MNGFNFNALNNSNQNGNILAQLLAAYAQPQQQEPVQQQQESNKTNSGVNVFEINMYADIDYIEVDKSGKIQMFICQPEKRIYTRRYNHSKQSPDYCEYIQEEETKKFQKPDNSQELGQVATALSAIVDELKNITAKQENISNEIQEIKNKEPIIVEKIIEKAVETVDNSTGRNSKGQFVKKGDK